MKAALDDLLKDAPILAGMKFVHWFDREIPQEDDPLYTVDFGYDLPEDETDEEAEPEAAVNELTARNQANQIPESVYSGQLVPDLDNVSYYILLLSGANSRVMIRRYDRGSYPDLRRNLGQWYADLALTNQGGTGNIRPVKLAARLLRLLKFQKPTADPLSGCQRSWPGSPRRSCRRFCQADACRMPSRQRRWPIFARNCCRTTTATREAPCPTVWPANG